MSRSSRPIVVLDLGGVLVSPEGPIADLARALDADPGAVGAAYWRHRDAYDRGGPADEFWGRVTAELGRTADVAVLDRIDTRTWSRLSPPAAGLLAELDGAGTTLTVLSNAPASLAAVVRAASWSRAFRSLVFSADVGLMKPEPEVYAAAEHRYGAAGDDLLFFDDRPGNVEGARRAGWRAEVWTGVPAARAALAQAGVLGS